MQIRKVKQQELRSLAKYDADTSLTPWSYESYLGSFNNNSHHIYVLESGAQIIGCIVFAVIDLVEAEVLQLWVCKNFAKRGNGTKLLQFVIEFCQKRQVGRIFLEVREDNFAAIGLYQKMGFIEVGIRQNYYRVDNWYFDAKVMQLIK